MTTLALQPAPRLIAPGSAEWAHYCRTFNLLDDLRPAAIAVPENAQEVAAAVGEARRRDLRVVIQATGHNASAFGTLDDAMIVNTSCLTGVEIDAPSRRVRVGAATKWELVTPRLSDLGLAGLHGSSPDVGIAGYSLGGGIGWLARKHGLQANAVTSLDVVTADGELRRVDAEHDADLFWALRGGNGNFGVVTSVEFSVVPVPELYAGAYFFPVSRTAELVATWKAALPTFPEELTTWVSVIHFPPDPALPDFARGRSLAILMASHLGSEVEGRALLAPFRRLGPELDTFATQQTAALGDLAMDPVEPLPYRSTTAMLDELPDSAIPELARIYDEGSDLALLQLRHAGGALSRVPDNAGARSTLPGEVALFSLGVVFDDGAAARVHAALEQVDDAIDAHRVGFYPNFVEHPADARAFFDDETWARLLRVKAAYDPEDLFRGNHHIARA